MGTEIQKMQTGISKKTKSLGFGLFIHSWISSEHPFDIHRSPLRILCRPPTSSSRPITVTNEFGNCAALLIVALLSKRMANFR